MNRKVSVEWIFSLLGIVFWVVNRNLQPLTLVCVFYAIFTGFVWSAIPQISKEEDLGWKHVLSPFVLNVIMMLAGSMKFVASADTVMFTAMALIHIRAAVFSFNRFSGSALMFPSLQFLSFAYVLVYLFQKNILPFTIHSRIFHVSVLALGTLSMGMLIFIKRKMNEAGSEETVNSTTSDS